MASSTEAKNGRLLPAYPRMRRRVRSANTFVVLTSDNDYLFGQHRPTFAALARAHPLSAAS